MGEIFITVWVAKVLGRSRLAFMSLLKFCVHVFRCLLKFWVQLPLSMKQKE